MGVGGVVFASVREKVCGMRHRNRLDIMADILKASLGGSRKTHVMYRCNLSFTQLEKYLGVMRSKGLLKIVLEEGSQKLELFEPTEKGNSFLQKYGRLKALLSV